MAKMIARILAFAVSIFWFWFAIESLESTKDIINLLPWVILLFVAFFSYSHARSGGIMLIFLGIASFFFFHALYNSVVLWALSVPLVLSGCIFLFISRKDRKHGLFFMKKR